MEIDSKKLARQELGVNRWFENNCLGILDWHTGVGKTMGAKIAIKQNEKFNRDSYIIAVPSPMLKTQWVDKLSDFPKHLLDRILIKSSTELLLDGIEYECDVLIVDELHEFATEERIKIINSSKIKFKKFLGLTASADDKNFRKILQYFKVIDYISAEEAKREKFVADFIEYNLAIDLTVNEKEIYDKLTETISKQMPKFDNDISRAQYVLSGGKNKNDGKYYAGPNWALGCAIKKGWRRDLNLELENHRLINDLWNPNCFIGYARSLLNAVRARQVLLFTANAKYNTTLEIMDKFNKVKTILFSESTEFADKIGIILNNHNHPTVVFHSGLKTKMLPSEKTGKFIKHGKVKLKNDALRKIKTGIARAISTAKSLDKGFDVEDLRLSITTSGSQNITQDKQRRGRASRKELESDVPVLLINIYCKDTVEERSLENRQSKIEHQPIIVSSVADITYIPAPNKEFTINDI